MKPLLTAKDISEVLAIPLKEVYRLVRLRKLKAIRIGRRLRFTIDAVLQMIGGEDD